ncbi:MAG TPA: MoaD/ThiS family protein [Thermoplasmata archaeon]|nr:MoaD/ThiS family protein [Thermoplasmata archaeon]
MGRPVRVLLFAMARTAVGRSELEWTVPPEGIPASELARQLVAAHPRLAAPLRASRLVRNGRYVRRPTERVRPGDEFAIHPPYGGG